VIAIFFLLGFIFSWPATKFRWKTRKWEAQIKREQDPEKLRAWAKELLVRYKDNPFPEHSLQTNQLPFIVPNREYGRYIWVHYGGNDTNGHVGLNPTQDFVGVDWGGTWLGSWGITIGETNFVCDSPDIWEPGMYFFRHSSE
jgi:hypothetical protein